MCQAIDKKELEAQKATLQAQINTINKELKAMNLAEMESFLVSQNIKTGDDLSVYDVTFDFDNVVFMGIEDPYKYGDHQYLIKVGNEYKGYRNRYVSFDEMKHKIGAK